MKTVEAVISLLAAIWLVTNILLQLRTGMIERRNVLLGISKDEGQATKEFKGKVLLRDIRLEMHLVVVITFLFGLAVVLPAYFLPWAQISEIDPRFRFLLYGMAALCFGGAAAAWIVCHIDYHSWEACLK